MPDDRNPFRGGHGRPNEIEAHRIGRGVLLALLCRDPTVVAAFVEESGGDVLDRANRLGGLGETIAHRVGLVSRVELCAGAQFPLTSAIAPLRREYHALNEDYIRAFTDARPAVERRLKVLVFDTWRLEWPWLVFELDQLWCRILGFIIGTEEGIVGTFRMAPTRLPPAPPIEPGESREAYLRRLAEFYPKAPPSRRGRTGVRVNAARIERDVRIFYRLVLMRPEPDTIYAVTQAEGMASPSNTKRARDRGRTVLEKGVPPFRVVSRG